MTPLVYDIYRIGKSAWNSGTYSATYTGGASGTVTYNWQDLSTDDGSATFQNPVGASSQIISVTGILVNHIATATARCKLTDSQGNISYTPYVTFIYENASLA